jgi:D-lyxose ketol-isomerase
MKRSEINAIMRDADAFLKAQRFLLPPFAYWTPEDWSNKNGAVKEIVDRRLGWDITDFGQGNYERIGLFVFTMRNGAVENLKTLRGKTYAEKVLVVGVDQVTPLHFHWVKMEDIINRGGGELAVQLYNATPEGALDTTDVTVTMDGVQRTVRAGDVVTLKPGESITLVPWCYHAFWGVGQRVLVGEVSMVNDDNTDNRFYDPIGRFPTIEEDEAPWHLLVNDYERYYRAG